MWISKKRRAALNKKIREMELDTQRLLKMLDQVSAEYKKEPEGVIRSCKFNEYYGMRTAAAALGIGITETNGRHEITNLE